ncbi:hypothetical protein [Bacteroides nordii]|uniref:Uncharacterized protein n=1 Tax=Bacteroides nordii CL02T12C05 TaxID=997884 RepID=I9SEK7_9BACE|nr:hypothetical protein [Bacteroides nordii]EIY54316.1 hypothetical protein HMPREF1068_00453 [Bacteroides nordii CL02T12C05]
MKKTVIKLFGILFIVSLFALFFMKVNASIYVWDYSYSSATIDIQLKIDDKLILDDSLHSSPFFPIILDEKLRYGVHKISVSSKKAGVNQESKVFLFLNQYIYVGFLGADTLYLEKKALVNRNDSVAVFQSLFIEKTSGRHQSEFVIESRFNSFYTE